MTELKPYQGASEKLVLSIDLGTTFSGMSYAFLDKGKVPNIQSINRYSGRGDFRVPTILYYRADGSKHSAGAECDEIMGDPEYDELTLSRWFKLHLRPNDMNIAEMDEHQIPPLPQGKTIIQVYADFLRYMFECAEEFVTNHGPTFKSKWNSRKDTIELIFTYPNGWGGLQENKMLKAAVQANLVPDTPEGRGRVHFVKEGEAGLHYCVSKCYDQKSVTPGDRVVVVDVGGGTVDISSYVFKSSVPLSVEETSVPKCMMLGSVTVNMRAERLFRKRLGGSEYGGDESIREMMEVFETKVKPTFKNDGSREYYIKVGNVKNSNTLGIRRGHLIISRNEMLSFFRPSFDGIVAAIKTQFQESKRPQSSDMSVFLIGEFSQNEWLRTELKTKLDTLGMHLYFPNDDPSKAFADGAIRHYLKVTDDKPLVTDRIGDEYTLGTDVSVDYDPSNPEHVARKRSVHVGVAGLTFRDGFSAILKKGTLVRHNQEFSETYCILYNPFRQEMDDVSVDIIEYRGDKTDPPSLMDGSSDFKTRCSVKADLSKVTDIFVPGLLFPVPAKRVKVVLIRGAVWRAEMRWMENGEEKRSRAEIIYDDPDDPGSGNDVVSPSSPSL